MTSRLGRVAAAAVTLVLAGAVGPLTTQASADAVGSCSASRGVLVVVDFRRFGGSITRGCDATPTTGYEALNTAGFTTTGTQHDGPAFICRIDGKPTPSQTPCVRTPPASAYWSYWHANKGQTGWTYSSRGAQSSSPGNGSVDAWVFGATDVGGTTGGPTFTPAQVRAGRFSTGGAPKTTPAPPTRTTTAAPRTSSTAPAPRTSVAPSTAASSTRANSTAPSSTAPLSTAAATQVSPRSADTLQYGASPLIFDVTPTASTAAKPDSGSALPLVLVGGLVVILGGGAGWTVLRRRRADADL